MSRTEYFHRMNAMTPTRMWVNNVTETQAKLGIDAGCTGCTQNPSYVAKMLQVEPELCRGLILKLAKDFSDDNEVLIRLQAELVGKIAHAFLPLHTASGGSLGFVTVQGDPFRENTPSILRQADIALKYGPNVMPKIPAVPGALEAMAELAGRGIPLCLTEIFALRQAVDVCENLLKATKGKARPVVYLAHIAGIYDEFLGNYVKKNNVDIAPDVLWHAGIAIAKKVYELVKERRYPVEFLGGGARGLHHFTEMVGAEGSVTINWSGTADELVKQNPMVVQRFHMPTPATVIDELLEKLPDFRKGWFFDSIRPEEYEAFGPVALFRSMFEKSWREALVKIGEVRKGV